MKLEKVKVLLHRIETLHEAIAQGDDEHREWLREAIEAHFEGWLVPSPRGKGFW